MVRSPFATYESCHPLAFLFRSWYKLYLPMDTQSQKAETLRVATFKIDQADYAKVEAVAARDDRSVSAVLRLAVRQYLESARAAA